MSNEPQYGPDVIGRIRYTSADHRHPWYSIRRSPTSDRVALVGAADPNPVMIEADDTDRVVLNKVIAQYERVLGKGSVEVQRVRCGEPDVDDAYPPEHEAAPERERLGLADGTPVEAAQRELDRHGGTLTAALTHAAFLGSAVTPTRPGTLDAERVEAVVRAFVWLAVDKFSPRCLDCHGIDAVKRVEMVGLCGEQPGRVYLCGDCAPEYGDAVARVID